MANCDKKQAAVIVPAPPAPILPATNPLGALGGESKRGNTEPTNLVSKEDDPPNPSRVPILRKAIKKNIDESNKLIVKAQQGIYKREL